MGKWKRSEDDHNGVYGCWFISLEDLMETFDRRTLETVLVMFEAQAQEARQDAFEARFGPDESDPSDRE